MAKHTLINALTGEELATFDDGEYRAFDAELKLAGREEKGYRLSHNMLDVMLWEAQRLKAEGRNKPDEKARERAAQRAANLRSAVPKLWNLVGEDRIYVKWEREK